MLPMRVFAHARKETMAAFGVVGTRAATPQLGDYTKNAKFILERAQY